MACRFLVWMTLPVPGEESAHLLSYEALACQRELLVGEDIEEELACCQAQEAEAECWLSQVTPKTQDE